MALETIHTYTSADNRNKTVLTAPAYGAVTGTVHHAAGAYAVGSNIPAGRFVVNSPESMASTTRNERTVMLPDQAGTNLFLADATTDFSSKIASAKNADGEFDFIGITTYAGRTCKPAMENGVVNGAIPQAAPIGYAGEDSKWNYYPIRTPVDIATAAATISVYTETDVTPADTLYIRVAITNAAQVPPQLLGGVTNDTTDVIGLQVQPMPANVRIEAGGAAGSSVMLQLGGLI